MTSRSLRRVLLILALGANLSALAAPLDLTTITGQPNATTRTEWWVDERGNADLREVLERGDFRVSDDDLINPGSGAIVTWLRLPVINRASDSGRYVLSLNRALLPIAEITLLREDGRTERLLDAGSVLASYEAFGTLAASFELAPAESATLFVRYQGANWSAIQLWLYTEQTFTQARLRDAAGNGAVMAGVLSLIVFSVLSFAPFGRGIVWLYAVAHASFLGFYLHMQGFTTVLLWPDSPAFGRAFSAVTFGVCVAAMVQFGRLFFDTANRAPRVDRLMGTAVYTALIGVLGALVTLLVPGLHPYPNYLIYLAAITSWLCLPVLALYATLVWSRSFWPLLVAWLIMSGYFLSLIALFLGLMESIPLGESSYIVVFLEALFLALAISLRIGDLQRENERNAQALENSLRERLAESELSAQLSQERQWALQDLADRGQLLLGAGHDARQMLLAARSVADQLDEAPESELGPRLHSIVDDLGSIFSTATEAARSGGIGDELLALQSIRAQGLLQAIDLTFSDEARAKGLELRIRPSALQLQTDRTLLTRVLNNLVSNAIKYTTTGGVLVAVRTRNGQPLLQVWDTGPGLKAAELEQLLRGQGGRGNTSTDGEGVGLKLCLQLAQRMGAELTARSTPGQGTLFELMLPGIRISRDQPVVLHVTGGKEETEALARSLSAFSHLTVQQLSSTPGNPVPVPGRDYLVLVDSLGESLKRRYGPLCERWRENGACSIAYLYDRSGEQRAEIAGVADLAIYRPAAASLWLSGLYLLKQNLARRSEESAGSEKVEDGTPGPSLQLASQSP